jgi:HK97 family phage prohead protease
MTSSFEKHIERGSPLELKLKGDETTGLIEGYGAIFSNVDSFGDVIARGAFKETLAGWKRQGKLPPMLLQHGGFFNAEDDIPIGKWTHMAEDEKGLIVRGRLINLDTEQGKRVYGAIREKVFDGLSIGYRAKEFSLGTKPSDPRRTLNKVELVEVSLVTFPANDQARILNAKSVLGVRHLERAIRALGYTRSQAKIGAQAALHAIASRTHPTSNLLAAVKEATRQLEALRK